MGGVEPQLKGGMISKLLSHTIGLKANYLLFIQIHDGRRGVEQSGNVKDVTMMKC